MLACLQHRAAAGWRCTRCEKVLCPACAASPDTSASGVRPSPSSPSGLVVCTHCGALAATLRERRAVLRPFRDDVLPAVKWPLQREGILCCAAAAVILWALGAAGGFGGLIADGIVLAYLFQIVRHTARGGDDFPAPADFRGFFEDVLGPLFRILLVSVWLFGPAMMWAFYSAGGDMGRYLEGNVLASRALPVLALLGFGAFLFPMALVAASLPGPVSQVLNPLVVIGYAIRLRADYAILAGFCLVCSLAESLLNAISIPLFSRFPFPDLWRDFVLLFMPMAMFRVIGLFVRTFGDVLGYGMASDYLDPVLGGAVPRGKAPAIRATEKQPAPDAIELPEPGQERR